MSPATTCITGIRAVSIPVENQDDALRFYTARRALPGAG